MYIYSLTSVAISTDHLYRNVNGFLKGMDVHLEGGRSINS